MEKTYTEQVHYKITFEGVFSRANCYEEELYEKAEDLYEWVMGYISDSIADLTPVVELTQLQHFEEKEELQHFEEKEGESNIKPYPRIIRGQFLQKMIEAYTKNMK
jgi:hypothetical protein